MRNGSKSLVYCMLHNKHIRVFLKKTLKITLKKFSNFSNTYYTNILESRNKHNVLCAFFNEMEGKTYKENKTLRQFTKLGAAQIMKHLLASVQLAFIS